MRQTSARFGPHHPAREGLVLLWLVVVAVGLSSSALAVDEKPGNLKSASPTTGGIGAASARQPTVAASRPAARPPPGQKRAEQKAPEQKVALPVPPMPPPTLSPVPYVGVTGFLPAPVPNRDIAPPSARALPPISVAPSTFRLSEGQLGSGYPYGASANGVVQSRAVLVPGVVLKMPLR